MKRIFIHGLGQTNNSWNEVIRYINYPNTEKISLNEMIKESKSKTFNEVAINLTKLLKKE